MPSGMKGNGTSMESVKVSARSVPKAVAGAIAAIIREGKQAEVQAVGAGAVNQAVKAIAIACVYMKEEDTEIVAIPSFAGIDINGEERTAICLVVEKR